MKSLPTVIRAEHRGDYKIHLTFNDGVESTVDFAEWLHGPVFEPLKDVVYFQRFFLDGGTVVWPNGADIAPETLYERAKDWLLNDPRFLKRIEAARQSFRAGRGVPLEEVPE